MSSVLEDLYLKSLDDIQEKNIASDEEVECYDCIREKLSETDKALLDKFVNLLSDRFESSSEQEFVHGFKLGFHIAAECLL